MDTTGADHINQVLRWQQQAMADGEPMVVRIVPPVVQPTCAHCWHSPRVWQGPLPVPRHCCWCGVHEGPQHGPYAEG